MSLLQKKLRLTLRFIAGGCFVALGISSTRADLHWRPGPPPPSEIAGRPLKGPAGIRLVWIPAGTFKMGVSAYADQLATVHFSRGFWMGSTEVTQHQYQMMMGANPSQFKKEGPDAPVDSVSWNDAMEFSRRLTAREKADGRLPQGYEFRLPTEAEWEYACRAGGPPSADVNGDGNLDDMSWYSANSGGHPHPVGLKRANAWGLYDMQGNAAEWIYDWLGAAQHGEVTEPAGPEYGTYRITRGGSWVTIPDHIGLSHRLWSDPDTYGPKLGFRVVLAPIVPLPPPPPPPHWTTLPPGPEAPANLAGHSLSVSDPAIQMQWVAAGSFKMGDFNNAVSFVARISRGFWLSRTEITQAQWQSVMGSNPSHFKDQGPDAPVDTVSFDDAMEFCRHLNRTEGDAGRLPSGYEYRVPTEAEWEYACRAGTTGHFTGDGVLGDTAWYGANSGGHSHPVAQKMPNAWGLYDMEGNVWEACWDRFGIYPKGEVTDPAGVESGTMRLSRGGCRESADDTCGVGHRTANAENFKSTHTGMRLALAPKVAAN